MGAIERRCRWDPLTSQDNVALKGVPCLLGTNVIKDWTPNTDATVVTRILEAGGEITGKAVCENLSLWGVSCSSSTGMSCLLHSTPQSPTSTVTHIHSHPHPQSPTSAP
jgi:Asp-tRNA(Asn)/Glu-tRNA(Gln) amidotransferase A subunit family amidase